MGSEESSFLGTGNDGAVSDSTSLQYESGVRFVVSWRRADSQAEVNVSNKHSVSIFMAEVVILGSGMNSSTS